MDLRGSEEQRIIYTLLKELYPSFKVIYEAVLPNNMRFDCFVKQIGLVVELDGDHHYEYVEHFHKDYNGFLKQRFRDNKKDELANELGIKIVRIKQKERYKEAQNLLTKKSDDVLLDEKIQAHKKAINERNERLEVLRQKFNKLSKIKLGKSVLRYDDGTQEIIKVSLQDELKAVEALAKLDDRISKAEGTDAPTKTATTSVNGEDLEDPITTLIKKGGKIIINGGK